jgi:hypothetical protein
MRRYWLCRVPRFFAENARQTRNANRVNVFRTPTASAAFSLVMPVAICPQNRRSRPVNFCSACIQQLAISARCNLKIY